MQQDHNPNAQWMVYELGQLRGTITTGLEAVHRRLDDQGRQIMRELRQLQRRADKADKMPWAQLAAGAALVAASIAGMIDPARALALWRLLRPIVFGS